MAAAIPPPAARTCYFRPPPLLNPTNCSSTSMPFFYRCSSRLRCTTLAADGLLVSSDEDRETATDAPACSNSLYGIRAINKHEI
ncbi:hypothetical protein LINPERHAP1_LOCUS33173, partial [Linum perenne]